MKQYLVIGLGSFGTNVVKTLYEAGEKIVAINSKNYIIQEVINSNLSLKWSDYGCNR